MSIKRHFINAFLEEVERLNGVQFEEIGRYVMELITNQELIQKGHNPYGKPVGYTVDYEQLDRATLVGQSGTDSDYFTSGDKPLNDVKGSIKNCPNCKTVYLFSNHRATGGNITKVIEAVNKAYPKIKVRLYDAEAIADTVYRKIFCEYKVKRILQYLPKAFRYYQMYAHSHSLPSLPVDYVRRPEEDVVCNLLTKVDFIQIYGLSGIGKTLLTIAVAERLFKAFNTVIWIDGEKLNTRNLKEICLNAVDQSVSFEDILSNLKCLIIIDNLNKDVANVKEQIAKFNKKGSKCIVTSLQCNLNNDYCLQLNVMPYECALEILHRANQKPTEEQADKLIQRISGYPLLLNLSKSSVDCGDFEWDDIIGLSALPELEDPQFGASFASRIIGKYVERYPELFSILRTLDSTRICKPFIRELNPVHCVQIVKAAILEDNELYYYRMHSIVLESLKTIINEKDEAPTLNLLSKYLDEHLLSRDPELYTLMAAHLAKIESLQEKLSGDDMLRHKMVLACLYEQNTYLEHDRYLRLVNRLKLDSSTSLVDLLLEAEKQELLINNSYLEKGDDSVRIGKADKAIEYFEKKLKNLSSDDLKSVCLHHIAKWKSYSNNDEAEPIYLEALKYDAQSYRTRLQLARLYSKKFNQDKVYEQTDIIIRDAISGSNVPLSVILSTFNLLSISKHSQKLQEYLKTGMDLLTNTIEASLSCHNAQVYYVLSNLSGTLSYNHSDVYNLMCSSLPPILDINKDEKLSYQYANILTRLFQYVIKDEDTREMIYQRAVVILTSIKLRNVYELRTLMNLYIGHGNGDEALKTAERCDDKDNIFLFQSKAKAYILKAQYEDALQCINYSIGHEADCAPGHKAAFRHDKATALFGLKEKACLNVMEEAISLQTNKKVVNDWKAEMEDWTKSFDKTSVASES